MDDNLNDHIEENAPLMVSRSPSPENHLNEKKIESEKKEVEINSLTKDGFGNIKIISETRRESVSYNVIKDEVKHSNKPAVISLIELPKYKNFFITVHPFIINGYRIHHSIKDCLKSVFTLHNETLNIWTHLFPFLLFFSLFLYSIIGKFILCNYTSLDNNFKSYAIVYLFMFTTFLFLLFSSIHHTFNCHSNEVWQCCYKIDLLGVIFQLVGTTMCSLQFMFHDFQQIRIIYGYSFLILGCVAMTLSMFDLFISAKLNMFMMFLYASLFLISFLSSIHWVAVARIEEVEKISPYVLMGFIFVFIGFAIFLAKFPECIIQHKFIDYFFNSHIIWHLCVVGSALCYYFMLHEYYLLVTKD